MGFSPWDRPLKSSGGARKATEKLLLASLTQQKEKNERREMAGLDGKWRAAGGVGEQEPRGKGLACMALGFLWRGFRDAS